MATDLMRYWRRIAERQARLADVLLDMFLEEKTKNKMTYVLPNASSGNNLLNKNPYNEIVKKLKKQLSDCFCETTENKCFHAGLSFAIAFIEANSSEGNNKNE